MAEIMDQLGRKMDLPTTPRRIISIVPSQTEYLYDLGLSEFIVGQTQFCIHPKDKFKSSTKIGGTKRLRIEQIKELRPDIIVANKEENEKDQIQELEKYFPVWISDIKNLDDAVAMMRYLGEIFDRKTKAYKIADEVLSGFNSIQSIVDKKTAIYCIWHKPWMVAGQNTFINSMLDVAGFENAISEPYFRYPELTDEGLATLNTEVVLLSSEPFPFKQRHVDMVKGICPHAQVMVVDGELFSWYGSRLLKSPEYFQKVRQLLKME